MRHKAILFGCLADCFFSKRASARYGIKRKASKCWGRQRSRISHSHVSVFSRLYKKGTAPELRAVSVKGISILRTIRLYHAGRGRDFHSLP